MKTNQISNYTYGTGTMNTRGVTVSRNRPSFNLVLVPLIPVFGPVFPRNFRFNELGTGTRQDFFEQLYMAE